MKKRKKSQVSIEYLSIMGFIALITIPLLTIYFTSVQNTNDEIRSRQALQIARKISDSAESVYFLGEPSQTTIKVYIPQNIKSAALNGREVVFSLKTKDGTSDIVQLSSVNMTGQLPATSGIHLITIKAQSNNVDVSYS